MRYRSLVTTLGVSSRTKTNLVTQVTTNEPDNPVLVDSESHLWDVPEGSRKATKACTHLKWLITSLSVKHNYDASDMSNAPNPKTRYDGQRELPYASYRPSAVYANAGSYIPVTSNSSDDLGNCVFNAYNQFVNGITALNSSVSIAEARETPALFAIWQRRLSAPRNIVNGFLNYSFGWRPLFSDLVAIHRELKSFPKTVRKRLKAIGDGEIVRHFKFRLDNTVNDLNVIHAQGTGTYFWNSYYRSTNTRSKSRTVVVTIRANVKPKLGPEGQEILNKLGTLGLIPSLATLWSITRLSFVVDWFYNVGAAIENLQGSLTHNISNVSVCISDLRTRQLVWRFEDLSGQPADLVTVMQRYYSRSTAVVPRLPAVSYPRRVMPYALLGALGLTQTKLGGKILDKGPKLNVDLNLNALKSRLLRDRAFRYRVFGHRINGYRAK